MRNRVGPIIDITQTYAFQQARWKSVVMAIACLGFIIASILMIAGIIDGRRFGLDAATAGWIGLAVFGLFLMPILWRLLAMRGPALTVSPQGLRDIRVAANVIPWAAIERIGVWEMQRQKFLVIGVAPADETKLGLTRIARWTRSANRSLGADGLCIGAQGLPLSFDDLGRLVSAHLDSRPG